MIAEFSASIVAHCCDTQEQQMQLASAGVIPPLVNLLHSGHVKAQEAALDALATLCRENSELGEIIIHAKRKSDHGGANYIRGSNLSFLRRHTSH